MTPKAHRLNEPTGMPDKNLQRQKGRNKNDNYHIINETVVKWHHDGVVLFSQITRNLRKAIKEQFSDFSHSLLSKRNF
jgi:hypothetical protein